MGYNQRQAARRYRLIWREGSMQSCWATTSIRFVHFQMIRRGFSRSSYACVWRKSPIVVATFFLVKRALLEWRVQISSCASHSSANLFLRVSGFIFLANNRGYNVSIFRCSLRIVGSAFLYPHIADYRIVDIGQKKRREVSWFGPNTQK